MQKQKPSEENIIDLSKSSSAGEQVSDTRPVKTHRKRNVILLILGGFFFVLIVSLVAGYFGYQAALEVRKAQQASQIAQETYKQFQLGLEDEANGRYETAQRRYESILEMDPGFPGIQEKLAEVGVKIAQAKTPTVAPSPTPQPTPDTRGEEELYNQILQLMRDENWVSAVDTLDALRNLNKTYRVVDVDGLYYIALRYRGVNKILLEGNLEGGTYDLALAERFAPLDRDADSYRNWARYYITGASFWQVDWERVISYFSVVEPAFPMMRDSSGMTAQERYRLALKGYGDDLVKAEDFCKAVEQYRLSQNIAYDPSIDPLISDAETRCAGGEEASPAETSTVDPNITITPGSETPTVTETPTVEGTPNPGDDTTITPTP